MNTRLALIAPLALFLQSCGSPEKTSEPEPPPSRTDSQDIAAIQRLEDTRAPGAQVEPFLSSAEPAVRRRAALAIGRIGDAKSIDALAALLDDADLKVAAEAAFALGLVKDPAIAEPLRRKLDATDPDLRAMALQAISRLGRPGDLGLAAARAADRSAKVRAEAGMAVARMAAGAKDDVDASRLRDAVLALKPLLRDPDAAVRWRTAYALARVDGAPLAAEIEAATVDQDALVRAFATRALAKLKDPPEAALMRSAGDADPRVAWEGVAALSAVTSGAVVEALLKAASGGESATVARALQILGERGEATPGTLKAASRHPSAAVRGMALWAKAYGHGMDAFDECVAALKSPDEGLRRGAARALVAIGTDKAKAELMRVVLGTDRLMQMEMLGEIEAKATRHPTLASEWDDILSSLLDIPDAAIRATVASVLKPRAKETKWDVPLERAFRASAGANLADAREAILAWFEEAKRGRAVANEALADESPAVRAQAAKTLEAATGEPVRVEPAPPRAVEATPVEEIGWSTIVKLETTRGDIRIRLLPDAAPAMCSAFLRLVKSGFYDGKRWHRVVPNFVIQGGDPRGDGWGDAGFTLRDEWSRETFDAGVVGMATAGKDTGSCQLFIMSAPAPHLDGNYTAFARVESGMDVVRAIEVGDRIVRAAVDR
ncbi:MAG: peptidylprolyl isomerase [Planctomycetia bacterium]|nr:peptidylprolyl isomerase [Planctomycetia bacterium]